MDQSTIGSETTVLEERVSALRRELSLAERQLRLARGAPAQDAGRAPGTVIAWHESVERALEEALDRLRVTQAAASRRAAELETIFESIEFPVLVFDAEGTPVRGNAAARSLLGLDPMGLSAASYAAHLTGVLRMRLPSGERIEADQLPAVRALRGEDVRGLLVEVTDRAGRTHAVALTGLPLRVDGRVSGAVVVWYDVTERLAAEAARREEAVRETALRRAADCAVRAKEEFLAMLGHELRNPLAPILTAVELLRLHGGEAFAREQAIIERHARRLMRLVDDLLDASRVARGAVELERRHVELRVVVDRAVERASPRLDGRGHRLDVSVPAGLVVLGDEDRLAQVLASLIDNAARFTPHAGSISVGAVAQAGRVRVAVKDDGEGIAPELLPKVFDLFVQGTRRLDRAEGGLGLGLALVRALTEAHGGRVEARSGGPGKGSEFVIELPLVIPATPRSEPEGPRRATAARPRARRVLVVDDNQDAADMLAEGLRLEGHAVRVAYDGRQALEVAAELDPEVALVDIGLPVMNGYELARHLRGRGGTPCHLVAVTGYGQDADRARAREHGFDAHVVKPVDLDGIRALVDRVPRPAANTVSGVQTGTGALAGREPA